MTDNQTGSAGVTVGDGLDERAAWQIVLDQAKESIARNGLQDPTDDQIIAAVGWRGHTMTYVVRNILNMAGFRRETPWIRRQLQRLEREGRVKRVSTSYATQICWALPTPPEAV